MSTNAKNTLALLAALLLNVLFFFIPLAGETGAYSAWHDVHPIFGIFTYTVALGFLTFRLITLIKKW
jgi:hypothetical protein